ncbi:Ca2 :Cation Antiporter (CaCA) Family [Achlya hypogyna]|uniref:Ca2:Cation Antiporter (CaCA) Family n=1 Tax=Achlya hypogyna TaxID=1202772 RepID=A0A1V9YKU4_ACHHY|nr:Ca2 :Cation Antiporter (CaCA) Family [Achlya hypogyna]
MNCSYAMELGPLGINYLELHYCTFAGWAWASCLLLALWLIVLFYLLGNTADEYFSPTLSTLCTQFHIPYDVAGVTFLAFGNGAPDVFSSLASSTSGTMETGLNALLGGAMFVTTVVVGAVLTSSTSPKVAVPPRAFCRDVLSLLIVTMLIVLCVLEESTTYMAVFPIIYAVYVLVVVLPTCCAKPVPTARDRGVLFAFWHSPQLFTSSPPLTSYRFVTMTSLAKEPAPQAFSGDIYDTYFGSNQEQLASPLIDTTDADDSDASHRLTTPRPPAVPTVRRRLGCLLRWQTLVWLCLDLPREATIPMVVVRPQGWSRAKAAMFVTTAPVLVLALSGLPAGRPHLWAAVGGTCIGLSLVTFVSTYHRTAPTSPAVIMSFFALGFAACVAWIYGVASELVAVLAAVGHITTLPPSVVGLTILSWGNSIGDWITNVAIAKGGCPEMALAGCFGGPVFNLLVGLGLPMLLARLTALESTTHVEWDVHCCVSLAFLALSLGLTLAVGVASRFQCPAWYGRVLFGVYTLYTTVHLALLMGWA